MITSVRKERSRGGLGGDARPLLVHCSAGIGRTGAFIAIDQGISMIDKRAPVDINQIIVSAREDRMALVQNVAQYKFVFQALLDYAWGSRHEPIFAWDVTLTKSAQVRLQEDVRNPHGMWTLTKATGSKRVKGKVRGSVKSAKGASKAVKVFNDKAPKVAITADDLVTLELQDSSQGMASIGHMESEAFPAQPSTQPSHGGDDLYASAPGRQAEIGRAHV